MANNNLVNLWQNLLGIPLDIKPSTFNAIVDQVSGIVWIGWANGDDGEWCLWDPYVCVSGASPLLQILASAKVDLIEEDNTWNNEDQDELWSLDEGQPVNVEEPVVDTLDEPGIGVWIRISHSLAKTAIRLVTLNKKRQSKGNQKQLANSRVHLNTGLSTPTWCQMSTRV